MQEVDKKEEKDQDHRQRISLGEERVTPSWGWERSGED